MKNFILYRISKIIIFAILYLIINDPVYAVTNRAYEPIVISGNLLPDFYNADLTHLIVYKYNTSSKTWTRISSQIDERGSDGKYLFDTPDNQFSANDELVVLAKDCGDKAPSNMWLDETTAQNYDRYEIKITDPYYSKIGYVYVFRTDNPGSHPDTGDMIDAVPADDRIVTNFYDLDFESRVGLMTNLKITNTGGGTDIDILDRMKLRINGTVDLSQFGGIGTLDLKINENDHLKKDTAPGFIDGKVRVIRNWKFSLEYAFEILGQKITYTFPLEFLFKLYPNSCDFGNASFVVPQGLSVDLFRFSFDLNTNANLMRLFASTEGFFDNYPDGEIIDANGYDGVPRLFLPRYGWNWWMQTGTQGTLLANAIVSDVGSYQYLYYIDFMTGTNDGTPDTGTSGSWGDTGVKYVNNIVSGDTVKLGAKLYFLGANLPPDSAEVYRQFNANPVTIETASQNYDIIAPAMISDLDVTMSDNSAVLTWTAPGDNGTTGGPADYYILKYSSGNPLPIPDYWWMNTASAQGLPEPAEPGTIQSFTVEGLVKERIYYFVMRSVDEAGNESPLSSIANGTTTPVELAGFTAAQQNRFVNLYWTTESETNNLGFAVERKFADEDTWTELTFIKGNGTTTLKNSYSYQDEPQYVGKTSYRLKQIDTDGTFTYSREISLNINAPDRFILLQNYPNPFNPDTMIEFEIPDNVSGQMELIIYDLLGRKVRELMNKPGQAGYYKLVWDGNDDFGREVVSGNYFYMLKVGDEKQIRRMIKLK
ncbi:T9SS type A sorting domain-containing protein [candidate division KSB1 bacterium]|nr:T9SS type A sorting domain-containing protein [candidate division KSB1 bacterium]